MAEVLLGTCGWSYAEWEGILYPQKQGKLKQYASIFPTAEIDSTFYRLPEPGTEDLATVPCYHPEQDKGNILTAAC